MKEIRRMQQQKIRRLSIGGDKEVFSGAATLENSDGLKEPATQRRSREQGSEHPGGTYSMSTGTGEARSGGARL